MTIIQRLKSDDQTALKEIFEQFGEEVYAVAFRFLRDRYDAEDVVQSVFLKLWNARASMDELGAVWSLLYVITKRLALNKLRDRMAKPMNEQLAETLEIIHDVAADSRVLSREIADIEAVVIDRLPKQQRMIYLLRRDEGLSYKEISEKLNISPNTVRNHVVECLKAFRKGFRKYGYHFILFFSFFN